MANVHENYNRLQQELENRSLTTTIVESGILTIILLVALLGNLLVCRAVYQNPRLRTITNYSVVVLALTDISMALFVMPLALSVFILGKKPFGHILCQIQAYVALGLGYSSIFVVAFMSVNRYFKIVKSDHLYRKVFNRKNTLLMIFSLLILAWLGPMRSFLQGQEFHFHPGKMICFYTNNKLQSNAYKYIFNLFNFILPYFITIFCYCRIYMKVRSHNKRIANAAPSTNNNTTTINRKDINIAKTLFAIFIVFTVCFMQVIIIDNIERRNGEFQLPRRLYVFYTLIFGMASAVNPLIYGLLNPAFRCEYKRILLRTVVSQSQNTTEVTS